MSSRYKDYTVPLSDEVESEQHAQSLRRRRSIADLLPPTQIKTRSMTKDDPIDVKLVYAQRPPRKKSVVQNENTEFDLDLDDTTQKVKRLSLSNSTPLRESNKTAATDGRITKTPTSLGKPKRILMSDSRVANRGLNSSAKRIPRRTRSKEQVEESNSENPFLEQPSLDKPSITKTGRRRSGAFSENTLQRNMEQLSLSDKEIPTPSKISEKIPEKTAETMPQKEQTPSARERKSISIARYKSSLKADTTDQKQDTQPPESAAKKKSSRPLRGVTAFVDAKTTDGDEAGSPFADMLRNLGARVLKAYAESVTHVIFKDGSQTTLTRVRQHPEVKLISLQWVQQCFEARIHIDEEPFIIDINEMPSYRRRRKSMEPKSQAAAELRQLLQMDSSTQKAKETEQFVKTPPQKPAPKPFLSVKGPSKAAIELARRKSLQFAPKVSSPLAKHCWNAER